MIIVWRINLKVSSSTLFCIIIILGAMETTQTSPGNLYACIVDYRHHMYVVCWTSVVTTAELQVVATPNVTPCVSVTEHVRKHPKNAQ